MIFGSDIGPTDEGLIKYFNVFPLSSYDSEGGYKLDEEGGNTGYPVFGDIFNRENAGFFAADTDQGFKNDGSDPEGILRGDYIVNNVESDPDSILYDPVSGILKPGETMIKDLTLVGDIPTNIALLNSYPSFDIWQDYTIQDPILNECIGLKFVYFKNGFPASAISGNPPSGDLLLNRFTSEQSRFNNKFNEDITYNNPVISSEFGYTYTDAIKPEYDYNVKTKTLSIIGIEDNDSYIGSVGTYISSISGMTEFVQIKNKNKKYPIELYWKRVVDNKFNLLEDEFENKLVNANVWNYPRESEEEFIKFNLENYSYRKKLRYLKKQVDMYWNQLNLVEDDLNNGTYRLICEDTNFYLLKDMLNTNMDGLTTLQDRKIVKYRNKEYHIILNNYLYFIMMNDDIYDWGVIDMPHFSHRRNPIFNVTFENGNLVYGVGLDISLGFH